MTFTCHNNIEQVRYLLQMLDSEFTDIFIHWDKNSKQDFSGLSDCVKKSKIYVDSSVRVSWGMFSMVEAELRLLEIATQKGKYLYYHLISGSDLPLKPITCISEYFETHKQFNYIVIEENDEWNNKMIKERMRYFYFFNPRTEKGRIWNEKLELLQTKLGINRVTRSSIKYKYGSQWFSIHDDLARYILSNRKYLKKYFNHTLIPDEMAINTLVYNSKFRTTLYNKGYNDGISQKAICRLIDWKRGNPYVFRSVDADELIKSDFLFARKFDETMDKDIILKIYENNMNKENI